MSYDTDFYTWTKEQALLLQQRRLDALDLDNLIEEIESMGRSERRGLESRLAVLQAHLLKWCYQPAQRSNSWRAIIKEQRRKVHRTLQQNPGLKFLLDEIFPDAYGDALQIAVRDTNLDESTFPAACPWALTQVCDDNFWPGSPSHK